MKEFMHPLDRNRTMAPPLDQTQHPTPRSPLSRSRDELRSRALERSGSGSWSGSSSNQVLSARGNPTSNDMEKVLMRLGSLEESLMKQCHITISADEKLAELIAKHVVEKLSIVNGFGMGRGVDGRSNTSSASQALQNSAANSGSASFKKPGVPEGDAGPFISTEERAGFQDDNAPQDEETNSNEQTSPKYEKYDSDMSQSQEKPSLKSLNTQKFEATRNSMQDEHNKLTQAKVERLTKSMKIVETTEYNKHHKPHESWKKTILQADASRKDTALDLVIAAIIVLNAMVIGISMDYHSNLWQVIDICFTVSFLIELVLKLQLHTCREHFSSVANCLDFMLVVLDVTQLIIDKVFVSDVLENAPSASIFRIVRLARLARLIRLARLNVFDDLVAMITGLVGGMTTLAWSIVFFGLVVYITALLFREFYGNREIIYYDVQVRSYFDTVPRSMLTVFRYFFGDFSTAQGISLFEAIRDEYGALNGLFVTLLFFVITIGLFNVIAAIFVESTLSAASALQTSRKRDRMKDELLWGTNISILVRKLLEYNGCEVTEPLSDCVTELQNVPIYEDIFAQYIQDGNVIRALRHLEISDEDHKYLFDILDNDNTGDILVSQLSDGVERLRGDPRRSDIICIDLMVRSIQEQANFLCNTIGKVMEDTHDIRKRVTSIEDSVKTSRSSASSRSPKKGNSRI